MATFFQKTLEFTRGIRFRLSVVYSAIFGICLLLLSLFITGEYLKFAREEYDQFLRNFALDLSNFIRPGDLVHKAILDIPLSEEIKYFPFVIQDTVVVVRDLNGNVLYSNREDISIPFNPLLPKEKNYSHRFMDFYPSPQLKMRGINVLITHLKTPLVIQVASSTETLVRQQERHLFYLLLIIPLSILITAITSTLVAGKALDPIRAMITRVETLLSSDSYRPLPVPPTHDEIAKLTRAYNTMIEKVQRTLTAQDQFVAHASHQLNTPLAIMRGELEVLLSKERSQEEWQRFHGSLAQELDRMAQLVRDMLLISRVEAGKAHFNFSPLRLDEVVTETVARLGIRAKDKNIALKLALDPRLMEEDDELLINGERQLVTCLCENLIENAIKYSPRDSAVKIKLELDAKNVVFVVMDQGPGVPQEVRERLKRSERFFRGEHTSNVTGSGLGLYLVGKIAEYHGANLEIQDRAPEVGARFVVSFPQKPNA